MNYYLTIINGRKNTDLSYDMQLMTKLFLVRGMSWDIYLDTSPGFISSNGRKLYLWSWHFLLPGTIHHLPEIWLAIFFKLIDRGLRKYIIFDKRANTNVQVSIFLTKIQTQNRITQNNFRLSHLSPWASQDTSGFIAANKGSATAIMSAISFWKEIVICVLFVNPLTMLAIAGIQIQIGWVLIKRIPPLFWV